MIRRQFSTIESKQTRVKMKAGASPVAVFRAQSAQEKPATKETAAVAAPADARTRVFEVVLIAPKQNGYRFEPDVLKKAAPLFDGVTVFCDHNSPSDYSPSVRDVVGVLSNPHVKGGQLLGKLHVSPGAAWLAALLDFSIELRAQGITPPDVGMSADISFVTAQEDIAKVTEILHAWSVDVVFDPAAGGETILRALNASAPSLAEIEEGEMLKFWRVTFQCDAERGNGGGVVSQEAKQVNPPASPTAALVSQSETKTAVQHANVAETQYAAQAASASQELLRMQCATVLSQVVGSLDLPEVHKAVIRERFEGKIFDASDLAKAVDAQKKIHASYIEKDVVKGIERMVAANGGSPSAKLAFVNGVWTDLDRLQFAADRLFGLPLPENVSDVPRLSGIRELYLLATGDYNFRGQFNAERVQFANATTSTMAGLVAVAMNKAVAAKWAELTPVYAWFHKIVVEEDFDSLNTINWVTVGGFGDLPTVSEGAAYTELVWDDNTETASWLKKGGYIGLTLEMMDRDLTRKAKNIPTAIATAGIRTLSAAVSSVLTANGNLADGTALFHTNSALRGGDGSTAASGNLSTTALSATEWDVHIQKTFAKTELNSGRRLGIRPKYVVVPIELEKTALQIFSSGVEPTANAFYDNVRVSGSENVVVCPEFTDANDWYSVVDPKVYPCLGVGYRYGRKPEIFTAGEETVGSMFTNDELRVKGRFFYGVGVIDWRGLRRATV